MSEIMQNEKQKIIEILKKEEQKKRKKIFSIYFVIKMNKKRQVRSY